MARCDGFDPRKYLFISNTKRNRLFLNISNLRFELVCQSSCKNIFVQKQWFAKLCLYQSDHFAGVHFQHRLEDKNRHWSLLLSFGIQIRLTRPQTPCTGGVSLDITIKLETFSTENFACDIWNLRRFIFPSITDTHKVVIPNVAFTNRVISLCCGIIVLL